jgi:1,4-dihydroxy-2-naphthoate octaprenyltransferase
MYFSSFFALKYAWLFLTALSPVVVYFFFWFFKVYRDQAKADFSHTMWLNFISATCLNAYFLYLFLDVSQVAQTF